MVERWLKKGNDINRFSRELAELQAPMPLIYPIINMLPDGVKLLLDAGADPNIKVGAFFRGPGNQPKYTHGNALVWAAGYTGVDVEIGTSRWSSYGDINDYRYKKRDFNRNRVKIIRLLIEYGANPYDTSYFGYTALDLVKMQRPAVRTVFRDSEKNDAEIIELLEEYMKIYYLDNEKKKLAFASSMIPRLGYDTPLRHLYENYDILSEIISYQEPSNPRVKLRMVDEYHKDKLTKSKQRLAIMKGMYDSNSMFGYSEEPNILRNVSRKLYNFKPDVSVQRRMMLEDENDRIADYLNTLKQYQVEEYDADGYDADGYDANGYDVDGYDVDGYDANGYDIDGYDVDGYDANGYDVNDYDVDDNKKGGKRSKHNRKNYTLKRY